MRKLQFNPNLPLEKIEISRFNVRQTQVKEGLDELERSIKEIGIQQPVVVFGKKGEKDKYELIVGQRRYLACKQLNWKTIPALITRALSEKEVAIISFSENIQRVDLNYKDKMEAATHLKDMLSSVKNVATAIGVSQQTVRNYLGYSAVPETIKNMVSAHTLAATTALDIARNIPDEKKAIRIAQKIKEERSGKKRRLILDLAKENPDKSDRQIINLANKNYASVTIFLTPQWSEALNKASTNYRREREDIVADAMKKWLIDKNFVK